MATPLNDQTNVEQYRKLPPEKKADFLGKLSRDPSIPKELKAKLRRAQQLKIKFGKRKTKT